MLMLLCRQRQNRVLASTGRVTRRMPSVEARISKQNEPMVSSRLPGISVVRLPNPGRCNEASTRMASPLVKGCSWLAATVLNVMLYDSGLVFPVMLLKLRV